MLFANPIQHINALAIHRHDMKDEKTLNKRKSSTKNAKRRMYRQSNSNISHVEHKEYDTKEKTRIYHGPTRVLKENIKVKPPELQPCKA